MRIFGPLQVKSPGHIKRVAWLAACIVAGLVTAIIGNALSGSSVWYLAIPAVVAIGWLFLADPTGCEPPSRRKAKRKPGDEVVH